MDDALYIQLLCGVRVTTALHMVVSVRKHKTSNWRADDGRIYRRAYSERIQKKWNKRFGFKPDPNAIVFAGNMIIHPATLAIIAAKLRARK